MQDLSASLVHPFAKHNIIISLAGSNETHGNIVATVAVVMTIVPGLGNKDVYLAYLPLAHILELVVEV